MTVVAIGVVAHAARRAEAFALFNQVDAHYLSVDDGTLGCEGNHRTVIGKLRDFGTEWVIVLEDDAQPVDDFRHQLEQALAVAPAPIVSLYLGTGYPHAWQDRIRRAYRDRLGNAHWLTCDRLLHAVGYAIRTELLPIKLDDGMAIDHALSNWATRESHTVGYSVPSLVDHADTEPVTTTNRYGDRDPRDRPRKAWRTGTRNHWTSRAAEL